MEQIGPQPNTNYLRSAISRLYGDEDDFIVLGLTGRTGSGCSTAAKILRSERGAIKHSLFHGNNPDSNNERKERIIYGHFCKTWIPFLLIQVRSVITTFLLDCETENIIEEICSEFSIDKIKSEFKDIIEGLRKSYLLVKNKDPASDVVKFYTHELPGQCDKLRKLLGESDFIGLYQKIGKNIRLSGNPFNKNLVDGKFFTLAERVNEIIKIIREENKNSGSKTFVVIDAIRSPLEALFFQERYASFFLMAVSTPEQDRIRRLRSLKFSDSDIESIDKAEYTGYDFDRTEFYSVQDISACLQRADLYVSNPDAVSKVNEFQELANQVIRFVSLIRRPGIITPSAIERCMQIAYTAKLNSGCISRQVGAVVTDQNFSIRSIGWNDAPYGQVPCNLRSRDDLLNGFDSSAYSEFERKNEKYLGHFKNSSERFVNIETSGRNKSFCFKSEYNSFKEDKNQVHTRSLHAEENAFLQISKYGLASIEKGILFTTASPCELCSKKSYQLGIKKIYYIDPYPGIAVEHILQGGANNPQLILFSGAIGHAFHKIYSPIVPYKDELNALIK